MATKSKNKGMGTGGTKHSDGTRRNKPKPSARPEPKTRGGVLRHIKSNLKKK